MKKIVLVVFMLSTLLFSGCVNTVNNTLVDTWINRDNNTELIFRNDGTFTQIDADGEIYDGTYTKDSSFLKLTYTIDGIEASINIKYRFLDDDTLSITYEELTTIYDRE